MRLPRSGGLERIASVVSVRSSQYEFHRPSEGLSRFGESTESLSNTVSASVWLFEPDEIPISSEYGDRVGGDLQGLASPTEDIERHDHVVHGTDTYEVQRIIHLPDEETKYVKLFSLTRVTNERDILNDEEFN